jgi:hypothetical protein
VRLNDETTRIPKFNPLCRDHALARGRAPMFEAAR